MRLRLHAFADALLLAAFAAAGLIFLASFARGGANDRWEILEPPIRCAVVHSPDCPLANEVHLIEGDGELLPAGEIREMTPFRERRALRHTRDSELNAHSYAIRTPDGAVTAAVRAWARERGIVAIPHVVADGHPCRE
jgi:hypothetical protein